MFRKKGKPNFNEKFEKKLDAISLIVLAKAFNVKTDELMFAVAETVDGDEVLNVIPVVLLVGTDKYIDLYDGVKKQNAYARGLKQNFFDCNVKYNADKFVFVTSSTVKAEIATSQLVNNFGNEILTKKY